MQGERNLVPVVLRPDTHILLGESQLTLAQVARGETLIGHELTVQGSYVPGTRRLAADVVVVGQKADP